MDATPKTPWVYCSCLFGGFLMSVMESEGGRSIHQCAECGNTIKVEMRGDTSDPKDRTEIKEQIDGSKT
jgi:hypothetical protein